MSVADDATAMPLGIAEAPEDGYEFELETPQMPFTTEAPGLDFLDPLREDRSARPDIASRIAEASPEEIAEAEQFVAERMGGAAAQKRGWDFASVAALTLIGLGVASLSVLNGLVPIQ